MSEADKHSQYEGTPTSFELAEQQLRKYGSGLTVEDQVAAILDEGNPWDGEKRGLAYDRMARESHNIPELAWYIAQREQRLRELTLPGYDHKQIREVLDEYEGHINDIKQQHGIEE